LKKIKFIFFITALASTSPVFGHALGNYSTNQYWALDMRGEEFRIHYQLDFAEIPSFKEMDLLDTDLDSNASEKEIKAYMPNRMAQILKGLEIEYDGKKWPLKMMRHRLTLYKGSGDMIAFRLETELFVEGWVWPAGDSIPEITVKSTLHENARGYREAFVLVDGRYSIEKGPWEDGDFRFITLGTEDELKNPVFQSFYNIFRLRLSDGPKPLTSDTVKPVDFKWTATTLRTTDEETLIGVYETDLTAEPAKKADAGPRN
jgi:hypothetical protein